MLTINSDFLFRINQLASYYQDQYQATSETTKSAITLEQTITSTINNLACASLLSLIPSQTLSPIILLIYAGIITKSIQAAKQDNSAQLKQKLINHKTRGINKLLTTIDQKLTSLNLENSPGNLSTYFNRQLENITQLISLMPNKNLPDSPQELSQIYQIYIDSTAFSTLLDHINSGRYDIINATVLVDATMNTVPVTAEIALETKSKIQANIANHFKLQDISLTSWYSYGVTLIFGLLLGLKKHQILQETKKLLHDPLDLIEQTLNITYSALANIEQQLDYLNYLQTTTQDTKKSAEIPQAQLQDIQHNLTKFAKANKHGKLIQNILANITPLPNHPEQHQDKLNLLKERLKISGILANFENPELLTSQELTTDFVQDLKQILTNKSWLTTEQSIYKNLENSFANIINLDDILYTSLLQLNLQELQDLLTEIYTIRKLNSSKTKLIYKIANLDFAKKYFCSATGMEKLRNNILLNLNSNFSAQQKLLQQQTTSQAQADNPDTLNKPICNFDRTEFSKYLSEQLTATTNQDKKIINTLSKTSAAYSVLGSVTMGIAASMLSTYVPTQIALLGGPILFITFAAIYGALSGLHTAVKQSNTAKMC